jgi:hypothetical protein
MAELTDFGFAPEARGSATYFARIHAIRFDPTTGEYIGVADPRWHGTAAGPSR